MMHSILKIFLVIRKKIFFLVISVFLINGCVNTETKNYSKPDDLSSDFQTIIHQGVNREYVLYVPDSYDGSFSVPVVLNFHGFSGDAYQYMNEADMRRLAEAETFILIYPQGLDLDGEPHWNACPNGGDNKSDIDDFGFIETLVEEVSSNYNIDLIGGDTTSSNKGLMISVTCIGNTNKKNITKRSGVNEDDLLVVSGDLGAAYMGLQVLEREKKVFEVNPKSQPELSNYTYCIQRQLKPEARIDIIKLLEEMKINPTAMIDISDGLSTEINHLSNSSGLSFHIYEDKIPILEETKNVCDEFKINHSIAFLNGGEDYELLFTVSKRHEKKIVSSEYLTIIGSSIKKKEDNCMITNLGQKININSTGWDSFNDEN